MMKLTDILTTCLNTTGICIDTRIIKQGQMFVAIRGPKINGNQYVKAAFENGASYALIDDPAYKINNHCILVDDALGVLQKIAKIHRESLKALTVIAIAGSNGKTTTKELIYSVLKKKFNAYRSYENFNNHIGVPINILNLTDDMEVAVIEIGANHNGEHHALCNICQPQIGIVTNCGKDHLEGYGSEDGVIASNKEVYDYLKETNGQAFVNANDLILCEASNGLNRIFYGALNNKGANVQANTIQQYPTLALNIQTRGDMWSVSTNLYGQFQADNILTAVSVGICFGVEAQKIQEAIEGYHPHNNRSEQLIWRGNNVLLDAYNANPSSMLAMIDFFDSYPSQKKIIILGGMKELGLASQFEHESIVQRLQTVECEQILLVGDEFLRASSSLNCIQFKDVEELKSYINAQSFQGHDILVKGSRGFKLETAFKTG